MSNLSMKTALEVRPETLRSIYGDELAIRLWDVMRVAVKTDSAVKALLSAVNELNDDQRNKLIDHLWERYYDDVADICFTKGVS